MFRKKAGKAKVQNVEANYPEPKVLANFNQPWKVQFNPSQRGPEKPVVFDKLTDWTKSSNDRIKYYSGTAFYEQTFSVDALPNDENILLSLGDLTAMAKVYVNGKYAGGIWTPPYQLDITDFVTNGENNLKVEVVNTWKNRIIGDLNLSENQRKTWCPVNEYNANSPLQPSGLFGPVTVSGVQY